MYTGSDSGRRRLSQALAVNRHIYSEPCAPRFAPTYRLFGTRLLADCMQARVHLFPTLYILDLVYSAVIISRILIWRWMLTGIKLSLHAPINCLDYTGTTR
jgi:hypothetical protein